MISKKTAYLRHSIYYEKLLDTANTLFKKGGENLTLGLRLFDSNFANIEAGQSWSQKYQDKDTERIRLCVSYPISGARIFELRQSPSDRIRWVESGLQAARGIKDLLSISKSLGLLGAAYFTIGDNESAKKHLFNKGKFRKRSKIIAMKLRL